MNANLIFVFLFVFLVILLTMYQLRLNSTITCLLTIITILLLFKLIKQKEYFSETKKDVMRNIIQELIDNLSVKTTVATELGEGQQEVKTTQPIVSENKEVKQEKQSFLDILIEILNELK